MSEFDGENVGYQFILEDIAGNMDFGKSQSLVAGGLLTKKSLSCNIDTPSFTEIQRADFTARQVLLSNIETDGGSILGEEQQSLANGLKTKKT